MNRTPHIVTGQFVRINQTPASLGHRMAAQLIDWGIELVWIFAALWLIGNIDDVVDHTIIKDAAYILLLFIPIMFYSLLWELLNHGQTPGKRLIKLRVVKTDGSMPSLGALIMRWLLWIADGPTMGFLGIFVMLEGSHYWHVVGEWAGIVLPRAGFRCRARYFS